MDAAALRTEMLQSLAVGMKNLLEERKLTNSGPYYGELTGRLDSMRTIVDYLMNVDTTPEAPKEKEEAK